MKRSTRPPLSKPQTLSREQLDFPIKLNALKAEAGRLGLWRTHHAIDAATTAVGWELADMEIENNKRKTRRKRK